MNRAEQYVIRYANLPQYKGMDKYLGMPYGHYGYVDSVDAAHPWYSRDHALRCAEKAAEQLGPCEGHGPAEAVRIKITVVETRTIVE